MSRLSIFLLLLITGFGVSCDDSESTSELPTEKVFEGTIISVGDGTAWSRVTLGPDGKPSEVAAVFTSGALRNLPGGHGHAHEFVLAMPSDASVEPYDHITLDWNAHGHAPPGIYDVPHYDIHFYFIDAAERDLIGPHDSTEFNRPLPESMLPPMYIETPGGVPRMGAHVIDALSPEIAGTGAFTHTFIYGKYDGEINFVEPMAAMTFLESKERAMRSIRRPDNYGLSGYFPGEYVIDYDQISDTYSVSLMDLRQYD